MGTRLKEKAEAKENYLGKHFGVAGSVGSQWAPVGFRLGHPLDSPFRNLRDLGVSNPHQPISSLATVHLMETRARTIGVPFVIQRSFGACSPAQPASPSPPRPPRAHDNLASLRAEML